MSYINTVCGWGSQFALTTPQLFELEPAVSEITIINQGSGVIYFLKNSTLDDLAAAVIAGTACVVPAGVAITVTRAYDQPMFTSLALVSKDSASNAVTVNAY